MPLNTRDGVADAPIEPGARTLCEPCDFGPLAKLWRLIVPWKPLPFDLPEIFTWSPGENASTVTVSPTSSSPASSRNSRTMSMGGRVGLLQMAELGLRQRLLLACAEGQLHGLVAVALVRADRGHRTRPGLEHGHALDAAVVEEPLGHAELLGEDRSHRR